MRLTITALALFVSVLDVSAEETPEKFMMVRLVLSDPEVFTQDGLAYKVVITNVSRSSITICGPTVTPPFYCGIEAKPPGEDWREIIDYPVGLEHFERGPINIAAGSTWAEYGKVFWTKGKSPVFDKEGKWELRGRVKCVLGSIATDSVPLRVKNWPPGKQPEDMRVLDLGQRVLNYEMLPKQWTSANLTSLRKSCPEGGIGKTYRLFFSAISYAETGEVGGKPLSAREAIVVLSRDLDLVRRDQLVFLLGYNAVKKEDWKEVAALLPELKEDSDRRKSLQGQLDNAIQKGKLRE